MFFSILSITSCGITGEDAEKLRSLSFMITYLLLLPALLDGLLFLLPEEADAFFFLEEFLDGLFVLFFLLLFAEVLAAEDVFFLPAEFFFALPRFLVPEEDEELFLFFRGSGMESVPKNISDSDLAFLEAFSICFMFLYPSLWTVLFILALYFCM